MIPSELPKIIKAIGTDWEKKGKDIMFDNVIKNIKVRNPKCEEETNELRKESTR